MLCDFSTGVEVVSFNRLTSNGIDRRQRNRDPFKSPTSFRTIEAGGWHNHFPGETRIHLNYAGVVSFYDTALFPSLKSLRSNKERWNHRLQGIGAEDVETFLKTLGSILDGAWDRPASGIDWKTLLRVVVDRYAVRLQVLNHLLNSTTDSEADAILTVKKAHSHMSGMLSPYRLYSASPPEIQSIPKHSWAIPVFEECATTHTAYIDSNLLLSQSLTYSEHLLLNSTKLVSKEICRVIVKMWAEGMEHSIPNESFALSAQELVTRWKRLTDEVMAWLDWSVWVTCQPACGDEVSPGHLGHCKYSVIGVMMYRKYATFPLGHSSQVGLVINFPVAAGGGRIQILTLSMTQSSLNLGVSREYDEVMEMINEVLNILGLQ